MGRPRRAYGRCISARSTPAKWAVRVYGAATLLGGIGIYMIKTKMRGMPRQDCRTRRRRADVQTAERAPLGFRRLRSRRLYEKKGVAPWGGNCLDRWQISARRALLPLYRRPIVEVVMAPYSISWDCDVEKIFAPFGPRPKCGEPLSLSTYRSEFDASGEIYTVDRWSLFDFSRRKKTCDLVSPAPSRPPARLITMDGVRRVGTAGGQSRSATSVNIGSRKGAKNRPLGITSRVRRQSRSRQYSVEPLARPPNETIC